MTFQIRSSKSRVGGIILFFIGGYMVFTVPDRTSLSYATPYIYGLVMMALSAALFIRSFIKKDPQDILVINFREIIHGEVGKLLFYILILFMYIVLIQYMGIVTSTVLFLVGSYFYMGIRSWKSYAASLIIFAGCYLLFSYALRVSFPHGFLY